MLERLRCVDELFGPAVGRGNFHRVFVVVIPCPNPERNADLFEVVQAIDLRSTAFATRYVWKKKTRYQSNNHNHEHCFDESESARHFFVWRWNFHNLMELREFRRSFETTSCFRRDRPRTADNLGCCGCSRSIGSLGWTGSGTTGFHRA